MKEKLEFNIEKIKFFNKNNAIEVIFGIIFIFVLLKFSLAYSGGLFIHDSPYQFIAGDMFWLVSEAEGVKSSDYLLERPFFLMAGNKDAYNNFPLGLPVAEAKVSYLTGAETYDALFHLSFFFTFASIILLYFILRKINVYVAIFGTPLTLFFFKWPFSYPLNFGAQMSGMNMFILFSSVFAFLYLKEKWMFLVLGLINGLGFYAHGRESLVFNVGIVIYFIYALIAKKFDLTLFKNYLASIAVTVASMLMILPLYFQTLSARGVEVFSFLKYCPASSTSTHVVLLSDFGILKWLIVAGLILVLAILFMKKLDFEKSFVTIFALNLVFNSYFCVLGNKTTQIRHFFPFIFALFLGFLIYTAYSRLPDNLKKGNLLLAILAIILIVFIVVNSNPGQITEYPVSNPYTWDAMKWIRSNLDDSENVLFLYGDNHYQLTLFFLAKKTFSLVQQEQFISYIQEKRIPSEVNVLEGSLGYYFVRTGFTSVNQKGINFYSNKSICDYDYVYFNKLSQNQIIQQYTNIFGQILVQESKFVPMYENELVVILKNPNKGGVCFEAKRIN